MVIELEKNPLTHLCYYDLFAQYFHCIMNSSGLLFDQNYLPKCPLAKQLQVLKVTHGLKSKDINKPALIHKHIRMTLERHTADVKYSLVVL